MVQNVATDHNTNGARYGTQCWQKITTHMESCMVENVATDHNAHGVGYGTECR